MSDRIVGRYHLYKRWYQKPDKPKHFYWWFWWTEAGERRQAPAGRACEKLREAREFLEERIRAETLAATEERAAASAARTVRFKDFAETLFLPGALHLRRHAETGVEIKEATRRGHRGRILNYLIPAWGERSFPSFAAEGFEDEFFDWLLDLKAASRRPEAIPRPISNSLRNNILETMSLVLREAKREHLLSRVPEFERYKRRSRRQDVLTDEELATLFPEDAASLEALWRLQDARDYDGVGIMFGAAFCLTVSAGLRSGEIRAMHRDQIIRQKLPSGAWLYGVIIDRAVDGAGELGSLKKSSDEDPRYRAIIIPERTIHTLDLWLERAPAEGLLFTYRAKPITKEHFLSRFEAGLARAGIPTAGRRLTVHALRYTYNTRMRPILSEEVLQSFTGHRSKEMTELYDRPNLLNRLFQLSPNITSIERFWSNNCLAPDSMNLQTH